MSSTPADGPASHAPCPGFCYNMAWEREKKKKHSHINSTTASAFLPCNNMQVKWNSCCPGNQILLLCGYDKREFHASPRSHYHPCMSSYQHFSALTWSFSSLEVLAPHFYSLNAAAHVHVSISSMTTAPHRRLQLEPLWNLWNSWSARVGDWVWRSGDALIHVLMTDLMRGQRCYYASRWACLQISASFSFFDTWTQKRRYVFRRAKADWLDWLRAADQGWVANSQIWKWLVASEGAVATGSPLKSKFVNPDSTRLTWKKVYRQRALSKENRRIQLAWRCHFFPLRPRKLRF